MTIDETKFDNKCEMNVKDDLQGLTEDINWWICLMTWRRWRWGHWMTWRLKGWGLLVRLALDVEGMKMGSRDGAPMLKQRQIELVRGYLAPHLQNPHLLMFFFVNLLFQETPPLQLFICAILFDQEPPFVAHVCRLTLSRIPLFTLVFIVLLF